MLNGKSVLLGVSGGIAAYKAAELVRLLVKDGATVHVVMTANAQRFIAPLTFQALTGNPVGTDLFNLEYESRIGHIHLARAADLVILAPATANLIAKMAAGIADDYLTTILLATTAPILVCPAMNVKMYEHRNHAKEPGLSCASFITTYWNRKWASSPAKRKAPGAWSSSRSSWKRQGGC